MPGWTPGRAGSPTRGRAAPLRLALVETEISELEQLRPAFLDHKKGTPPRDAPVTAMIALADFTDGRLAERYEKRSRAPPTLRRRARAYFAPQLHPQERLPAAVEMERQLQALALHVELDVFRLQA